MIAGREAPGGRTALALVQLIEIDPSRQQGLARALVGQALGRLGA
jgi:hypothetical protein